MSEEVQQNSITPWVEIVEQPGTRGLRFIRTSDGQPDRCIHGENRTHDNETFPTIKVHGHTGMFVVVVSCVSEDEPHKPHPHNLVGKECKKGVCTRRVMNTNTVSFQHVNIQCAKKTEVERRLELRKQINVNPFLTGFKFNNSDFDLKVVRLCFQVFLPDENGRITRIVPPIVSRSICDERYQDKGNQRYIQNHLFEQVEEQSEFCDVIIQVGTWARKYHWCVLTALPFFYKLYTSKMKEQQTGKIHFSIGSPYSVQTAIDFLYGKLPGVKIETASDVLEMADFLMIDSLKELIIKQVKALSITVETCVSLMFIASRFDIFIPKLESFYLSHLPELMKTDQMLKIDKESFRCLLTDKTLSYVNREEAFLFLLKWAEVSFERRLEFCDLLTYFDQSDIDPDFFSTVNVRPDLLKLVKEVRPEFLTTVSHDMAVKNCLCNVLVLYQPSMFFNSVFYACNTEKKCWYQIPFKDPPLFTATIMPMVQKNDTVYALTSVPDSSLFEYDFTSGERNEKKLKSCDGEIIWIDQYQGVEFAVSCQRTCFVISFLEEIYKYKLQDSPPHYTSIVHQKEFQSVVYISKDLSSSEVTLKPLLSVVAKIDAVCIVGDLVCLLDRSEKKMILYCLKKEMKTNIDLSRYVMKDGNGILSSSGSHVYILTTSAVLQIEFPVSPKKIIWNIQELQVSKEVDSSRFCQLNSNMIVSLIKGDNNQSVLRCQDIGGNDNQGKKAVFNIDIPETLTPGLLHQVLYLQIPKKALKCHIDCPHCKYKMTEHFDLFPYQQTFSSDEDSDREIDNHSLLSLIDESDSSLADF